MSLNDRQQQQRRKPLSSSGDHSEMKTPPKNLRGRNGNNNQNWQDGSPQVVTPLSPINTYSSSNNNNNNGLQHRMTPHKLVRNDHFTDNDSSSVDSKRKKMVSLSVSTSNIQEYDNITSLSLCPSSPLPLSPIKKKKNKFLSSKKWIGARQHFGKFLAVLILVSLWGSVSFTVLVINGNTSNNETTTTGTTIMYEDTRIFHDSVMSVNQTDEKRRKSSSFRTKQNIDYQGKSEKQPMVKSSSEHYPRVIFYQDNGASFTPNYKPLEDDLMLHAPPGEEAVPQDNYYERYENSKDDDEEGKCVPMSEWQTKSFPNCNDIHQLDLRSAGQHVGKHRHRKDVSFEDLLTILGSGWFRHTWRLDDGATGDSAVIKTLRFEREFYTEYYELHRRDAVAMERLTASPFVMDIYGYCGQSAINELADFGTKDITNLEQFDKQLRGKDTMAQVDVLKLQVAASLAIGVAHVHEVDGLNSTPSMAHYDLNPRNVAIVKGGKPKLNDFNVAEFLTWNPKTNQTCGFPSRFHDPWWRSPEEVQLPKEDEVLYVNEKVDVYALGNLLYHVLTTHSPRGKMKGSARKKKIREEVTEGIPPGLYDFYLKSKNPIHVAFKKAMRLCFETDPDKRPSARFIADIMLTALKEAKKEHPSLFAKTGI